MDILHVTSNIELATGKLLIAGPFLSDPNFARTVIFVCEHGADGTLGFVLNRPTFYTIDSLLPEFQMPSLPVCEGGPVQPDHLHLIHAVPDKMSGIEVIPEVYWGGSYDDLAKMKDTSSEELVKIRLFSGYSGWEAGQLETELEEGSWIVAHGRPDIIFEKDTRKIWASALESLGKEFSHMANFPIDPQWN